MDALRDTLHSAGMRATAARLTLLAHIRDTSRAQTATEIHDAVGGDLVTTYRNLASFAAAGLVREVRIAGNSVLYENADLHHHHHAICTSCGKVAELAACPTRHTVNPAEVEGFAEITGHTLEYVGICESCA